MTSDALEAAAPSIVLPDWPLVDAHHHLVDRAGARYLLDEYLADATAGHRIVASVYVELLTRARVDGPEHLRFVGEVEFAREVGEESLRRTGGTINVAAGVLAGLELAHPDVRESLDAADEAASGRLRGVRQSLVGVPADSTLRSGETDRAGLLSSDGFRRGLRALTERSMPLDIGAAMEHLGEVRELARAFPETVIVINHGAPGRAMRDEDLPEWRAAITDVAGLSNVRCKIGGFGMSVWPFHDPAKAGRASAEELARDWRPYAQFLVEAFGVERCMLESNYPTDARTADFVTVWNALKLCLSDASEAERADLGYRTAMRTYDLAVSRLGADRA